MYPAGIASSWNPFSRHALGVRGRSPRETSLYCQDHARAAPRACGVTGSPDMPELPEVETVVRDLRPRLVGRRIAGLHVSRKALRRKWSRRWHGAIVGRQVQTITRRGKWILIDLDGPWLLVHLGM